MKSLHFSLPAYEAQLVRSRLDHKVENKCNSYNVYIDGSCGAKTVTGVLLAQVLLKWVM